MKRTGQIALIPHGANICQKLIELVTRAPVHHVIVAISENECVSAEIPRVRTRPISKFPHAIWSQFDLDDDERYEIAEFAFRQIGKKYALMDDILIGIALLMRERMPRWIVAKVSSDNRWQCAELADASLLAAGKSAIADDRPPCVVFPGSFIPYFKLHGWWPKVYN